MKFVYVLSIYLLMHASFIGPADATIITPGMMSKIKEALTAAKGIIKKLGDYNIEVGLGMLKGPLKDFLVAVNGKAGINVVTVVIFSVGQLVMWIQDTWEWSWNIEELTVDIKKLKGMEGIFADKTFLNNIKTIVNGINDFQTFERYTNSLIKTASRLEEEYTGLEAKIRKLIKREQNRAFLPRVAEKVIQELTHKETTENTLRHGLMQITEKICVFRGWREFLGFAVDQARLHGRIDMNIGTIIENCHR